MYDVGAPGPRGLPGIDGPEGKFRSIFRRYK